MIVLLLLLGAVRANEPPELPLAPATAPGEGSRSHPITVGAPASPLLIGGAGLAGCSAVCEPLSSYAHLLKMEQYAKMCRRLYDIDTRALEADRDYWRTAAQTATATPLHRRPWFVAVTTSALVSVAFVSYDLTMQAGNR